MDKQELQEILESHRKWLNNEQGGKCANLYGADLCDANLCDADLRSADLYGANLCGANLCGANLCDANLYGANLRSADLYGANLYGADLRSANLYGANLDTKELIRKGFIVQRKLTGWKKCQNGVLVKLEIPKGAIVFSINNNKCRTNIAKVVKIEGGNGKNAISSRDSSFIYKLNKTVAVADFDCQYNEECGKGIHFFRTKKEAEEYNL